MRDIRPLGDKVIARLIDEYGERVTHGGVILSDKDGTTEAIRPRWFLVTHTGPEQEDVTVGQYVLVEQGRWTRGLDVEGTHRKSDYLFRLDTEGILAVSDDEPK